jgi:hypothetical protein
MEEGGRRRADAEVEERSEGSSAEDGSALVPPNTPGRADRGSVQGGGDSWSDAGEGVIQAQLQREEERFNLGDNGRRAAPGFGELPMGNPGGLIELGGEGGEWIGESQKERQDLRNRQEEVRESEIGLRMRKVEFERRQRVAAEEEERKEGDRRASEAATMEREAECERRRNTLSREEEQCGEDRREYEAGRREGNRVRKTRGQG